MIFPQEALDGLERTTIVGQTLRDGEYQVQRIIGQSERERIFLVIHTTLMIPLALKQMKADQPLAESVIAELDYILYDGDSLSLTTPPKVQGQSNLSIPEGSATDYFAQKALFLARLQHTAIPTLYDYFREDGYWYLVMDYIPGYTLRTYLHQHAPLSALEALNCALQICDALDYLHTQTPPVLFRDLTTDNIIVTPEGILMLTNLDGVQSSQSKELEDDIQKTANASTQNSKDTQTDIHAIHTLQALHIDTQEEYDTNASQPEITANLYSLGIILHDMLYAKSVKQNTTQSEQANSWPSQNDIPSQGQSTQIHDIQTQNAPYISTFLKSIIRLATRPDPVERFQSAQTFYLALERAYQIEEQRAFQQHLVQLSKQEEHKQTNDEEVPGELAPNEIKNSVSKEQVSAEWEQGKKDTPPITMSHTLELAQRRITRTALQRLRWERLEQEQIDVQMSLVDESLKQRSNISLSQISLQAIARTETPTAPAIRRFHRIIKVNFLLALVLCVIMASILVYVHVAQPVAGSINTLIQRTMLVLGNTQPTQPILPPHLHKFHKARRTHRSVALKSTNGNLTNSYWQALPSLPAAEADNAMVYVELQGRAYIYLNGGYRGPATYDHNLYRYDIKAAHWETVSNNHFPGMVNNAATVDEQGHIFFTGGYSSDTYTVTSLLYIYDPGTALLQKIVPPAQMPLGFGATILADRHGHLYINQGFTRPGDPHAQAGTGWYRYDIATTQWHQLASLPIGLGYVFTANDNNGGILLLGGASDAGQHNATNKIYRYDIATDSWTQAINSLPQAISGAAGCQVWPGQLAIIGGYDASHDAGNKNTWLIDLQTLQWRPLVDLTIGGSVLGAAACDGKGHIFLERGTNNPHLPTSDYWEMVVAPGIRTDD